MSIILENETTYKFDFDLEKLASEVIEGVLDEEKFVYESEVNILITDNEEIRKINNEFRSIDKETDVLSFPSIDFSRIKLEDIEDNDSYFSYDSGELLLGDIVLSIDRIISQSEEFGHSIRRETAFLIAHSMLHLLGYDHMTESEEEVMISKQKLVLNKLDIIR